MATVLLIVAAWVVVAALIALAWSRLSRPNVPVPQSVTDAIKRERTKEDEAA